MSANEADPLWVGVPTLEMVAKQAARFEHGSHRFLRYRLPSTGTFL